VTSLGLGGGPLGNLYHRISDEQAAATIEAAWRVGVRLFDTAPHYGIGLAERRLGEALRGYPRDEYVVSTKVGRVLVGRDPRGEKDLGNGFDVPATLQRVWDFSADGVRRSLDDSLTRMGLDRADIVLIHDPEVSPDPSAAIREAYPALHELRRQGVIRSIGLGSGDLPTLQRFAEQTDIDVVMAAGQYTLLRQGAAQYLLPGCGGRGIRVFNAGVFNSGLLAMKDPDAASHYDYSEVPAEVLQRARAIAAVCERHGVSLPHAAVAYASGHPAIASIVVGADSPEQIVQCARWLAAGGPSQLWVGLGAGGLLAS
jgi:D-threo-aldose 1-dehydrogenase